MITDLQGFKNPKLSIEIEAPAMRECVNRIGDNLVRFNNALVSGILTFTTFCERFNRRQLYIFSQKLGFDISCKLCPKETVCMKCQSLVSLNKNKDVRIRRYFKIFQGKKLSVSNA